MVEQSEYRAGRDPEKLLKLRPASYRDGIELCGLYDRFDSRAELRKNKVASRRCGGAVHCGIEVASPLKHRPIAVGKAVVYLHYRGEVIGLDLNSVPFKDSLIVAHRFERRGAGADNSDPHSGQCLYDAAGRGESLKLSDEFVGIGSDGEGGVSGILHAHLVKYACKGEFAAEGVAAMLEIHLSGLIGISLDKHRNIYPAQSRLDSVLVAEIGQTDDKPVIFAPVSGEELVIDVSVFGGFDGIVLCLSFLKGKTFNLRLDKGVLHLGISRLDDAAREKAAVCNKKRKFHFRFLR